MKKKQKIKLFYNKYKVYMLLMFIGIIFTFLYLGNLSCNEIIKIVCNIFAMLGSGVFCSSLVSLLIDYKNNRQKEQEKLEQSKYIVYIIRGRIDSIVRMEWCYLSEYIAINNGLKKLVKKETTILEAITYIKNNLNEILNLIIKELGSSINKHDEYPEVINYDKYIVQLNNRKELLFNKILPMYTILNKDLIDILINIGLYISNEIFNKEQSELLKEMQIIVDEIIKNSTENTIDSVIEYKEMFFDCVVKSIDTLFIETDKINLYNYYINE